MISFHGIFLYFSLWSTTTTAMTIPVAVETSLQQNRASLRMMIRRNDTDEPGTFIQGSQQRNQICFSPTYPVNYNIIKELNQIEYHIMEHYKQYVGRTHKQNVYSLRNQLRTGNLRIYVYTSFDDMEPIHDTILPSELFYVLKISGIWETATHVGITYKFMHIGQPIVMHK
jgi:hypothetical protein